MTSTEGAQLQANLVKNPAPLEDLLPQTASDYGKYISFPTLQGKQVKQSMLRI